MRRLNIPAGIADLARRSYTDAYSGLESESQQALAESLLGQGFHAQVRGLEDRPHNSRDAAHYDAQTLIATARQLEYVMTEIYEEEFPDLPVASGEIIDFDTSVPEGAQTFVYYVFSGAALARFAGPYTTGDAPRASIEAASVIGRVHWAEGSYGWHIREMRAAQYGGFPLDRMLADKERRAHAELAQRTFTFGREDLGMPGFMTHPNITILDAPADGTGSSRLWSAKTFDLVARDVRLLVRTVQRVSFGRRKVTNVCIPEEEMIRWESNFVNAGNASNITWLEAFQKLHPGVNFRSLNECSASFSGGRFATDVAIAYVKDRKVLRAVYPVEYLQHAPELRNLETTIPVESCVGGVILTEPWTVVRLDGIGQS